jgi:hypothetical protein
MNDYDDVAIHDAQQLEEIELLSNLIVMATGACRRLSQEQIDDILGVPPTAFDVPV